MGRWPRMRPWDPEGKMGPDERAGTRARWCPDPVETGDSRGEELSLGNFLTAERNPITNKTYKPRVEKVKVAEQAVSM